MKCTPSSKQPDIKLLCCLHIRWCHIDGAICHVFEHRYVIVKEIVNQCGCIVNKEQEDFSLLVLLIT